LREHLAQLGWTSGDVAVKAGISKGTASQIVNGKGRIARISRSTINRVVAVVAHARRKSGIPRDCFLGRTVEAAPASAEILRDTYVDVMRRFAVRTQGAEEVS